MNKLEVRTVFVDHRQNDQLEQLVTAEFVVNNKTYLVTKISSFIVNYSRELQIEVNIRKKE